jgi:uncharacterized protein involved in outer membrane biogenesis
MKKTLLGIALVVLAIAGGAWWLYNSLDSIAASAVRSYGPEITGVSVKLSSLRIIPADGSAVLRGMFIGNPKGFKTDRALSLGEISMVLDADSLARNVVQIKKITVTGANISYEYGEDGSNLDAIQRNINRYVSERLGANAQAPTQGPAKKFIIDNLIVVGGKITVTAAGLQDKTVAVDLPTVKMRGLGRTLGGATAGEIVQQVMGALTYNAARAAGSLNLGNAAQAFNKEAGPAADKLKELRK